MGVQMKRTKSSNVDGGGHIEAGERGNGDEDLAADLMADLDEPSVFDLHYDKDGNRIPNPHFTAEEVARVTGRPLVQEPK